MKRKILRFTVIVAILATAVGGTMFMSRIKPPPQTREVAEIDPLVEVMPLEESAVNFRVTTQGTVRPRTETVLSAEVSGPIVWISPKFVAGGVFEKGEALLRIDPTNYRVAVEQAEALLKQRQIEYEGSKKLRLSGYRAEADLASAAAALATARAELTRAKRNLERTRITAPYAGRILSKEVGLGQYVGAGTTLARIYAVDYVEIRLPLSERQLGFIDVPEMYRGGEVLDEDKPLVRLRVTLGNDEYEWKGRVVRAEGALDATSRQLFVVAQVDNPYGLRADGRPPLKIGSFVQARIEGEVLEDVFVIDRNLHRKNEYVVTIDDDSRIERREIEILWSDPERLVIREGLEAGDLICLTYLNFPADGMEVNVVALDGKPVPQEGEPEPRYRRRGPQADS